VSEDIDEEVLAIKAHIESAIHAAKLANDPSVVLIDAMLTMIGTLQHILKRFEAAVAKPAITEADVEQLSQAAARGADRRAAALAKGHVVRFAALGLATVVVAALSAGIGAYALAGGFRSGCYDQPGGGTFCGYWTASPSSGRVSAH
jgi:hypothetical protein